MKEIKIIRTWANDLKESIELMENMLEEKFSNTPGEN